jgi:hypothetical protein
MKNAFAMMSHIADGQGINRFIGMKTLLFGLLSLSLVLPSAPKKLHCDALIYFLNLSRVKKALHLSGQTDTLVIVDAGNQIECTNTVWGSHYVSIVDSATVGRAPQVTYRKDCKYFILRCEFKAQTISFDLSQICSGLDCVGTIRKKTSGYALVSLHEYVL